MRLLELRHSGSPHTPTDSTSSHKVTPTHLQSRTKNYTEEVRTKTTYYYFFFTKGELLLFFSLSLSVVVVVSLSLFVNG